tara:strand:- start:305 stop:508 length:204 start_codon:yes stop_codon:yes gene_type:complete
MPDFEIFNEGTVVGLRPVTGEAKDWLNEHTETEGWQWMAGTMWGDHRSVHALIGFIQAEGFKIASGV